MLVLSGSSYSVLSAKWKFLLSLHVHVLVQLEFATALLEVTEKELVPLLIYLSTKEVALEGVSLL